MAKNSKIEWTNHTVNLWWGCAKVHTGCKNCYAENLSHRFGNDIWGKEKPRKFIKSAFKDLNKYQRDAEKNGTKAKVFVGSMMDIFEESVELIDYQIGNGIKPTFNGTDELRQHIFRRISQGYYNNLIFLFLTKRPGNIEKILPYHWLHIDMPKNVWFGTSVSGAKTWKYAEELKSAPGVNKFLSIEPQTSSLNEINLSGIGWVIQGGESGPNKRPFQLEWAYQMKVICKKQNVPYFFKQIDKIQAIPKDLQIREFPKDLE